MESKQGQKHEPVLLNEVLEVFDLQAPLKVAHSKKIIDATFGYGGHSRKFIEAGAVVLGIDLDEDTLEEGRKNLEHACPVPQSNLGDRDKCFSLQQGNFTQIDQLAFKNGLTSVDGILVDLGVNTPQLVSPERGFSFQNPDADLDMRLDRNHQGVKASDLLNALNVGQLERMFGEVCGVNASKRLAKNTVSFRERKRVETVGDFLKIVDKSNIKNPSSKINQATLPFMAVRMAVNSELENIVEMLPKAFNLLTNGGKLAIISFHSGEDKIVKDFYSQIEQSGTGKVITKDPIVPSESEIKANPKSRSAKLRVIERI